MFETIVTNFTLEKILYIIKKRIIFMIIFGIISAFVAGMYAKLTNYSTYCAEISFYVYSDPNYVNDSSVNITASEISSAISLIKSYTFVIKSNKVLDEIIKKNNLPYSREELKSMIVSENVQGTAVFYVYVYDKSPEMALNIANAIADVAPSEISRVVKSGGIEVIDYADKPTNIYYANNTIMYTLLGGVIGFALLFAVFLLVGLLDTTIRNDKDMLDTFTFPMLGDIPMVKCNSKSKKSELLLTEESDFMIKESYLSVCTNLLYTGKNEKCPVYVVTSADKNDGKTLSIINVARGLEKIGKKVLVIDADLRKPSIGGLLKIDNDAGLSQYLAGIVDEVNIFDDSNVSYYTAGSIPPNPMELLANDRFANLITTMKAEYDYILIDMPPVGIVSDALLIKKLVTKYLIIVRANKSKIDEEKNIVKSIEEIDAEICGFIFNGNNPKVKKYKKYYNQESKC